MCGQSDDSDGHGPQIATRAASIEFLNVDRPLRRLKAKERLAVFHKTGKRRSGTEEDIQLILRDALGSRIRRDTVDSGESLSQPLCFLDRVSTARADF